MKTIDDAKAFQVRGIHFLANRKQALLGDQMRLGKTVQAILACVSLKAHKILVVCPASAKLVWYNHFIEWDQRNLNIQVVYGTKCLIDPCTDIIIINYDLLRYLYIFKQLISRSFAVGILDESHYLKNQNSQRTKDIFMKGGLGSRCHHIWALSGTPILNRPIEFFPLLKAVAPDVIDPYLTYGSYAKYFCGGKFDEITRLWDAKGATNSQELNLRLKKNFMLRRTKKQVFGELDKKIFQLVPIPAEGQKLKETMEKQFEWERHEVCYGWESDEEMAIVQRELGEYKVKPCVKHIKYLLDQNDKVVVFAWHKSVMKMLRDELIKFKPVMHMGGMSEKNKMESVTKFKKNPNCRVFLGNYMSAGIAIDLSVADTIFVVESSWVWGDIDQFSDRCFNFLSPSPILIQFGTIEDSLDEHKLRTVIEKKKTISEIIDVDDFLGNIFS